MKPLLIQHLNGEQIGRLPVWMMRQAGRYLPEYRAIRSHHTFWEMVTDPEVAARVSLLPVQLLPVDAVIFFSDILTLPFGMGINIEIKEAKGPVLSKPLTSPKDFDIFESFDAKIHTPYVPEALKLIRKELAEEKALLGFAGAPWTVFCYLNEGQASKHFSSPKKWLYQDPQTLTEMLSKLAGATAKYLAAQIESGAQMVQLFDTWLSEVPREFFINHYVPVLNAIFAELRKHGVPLAYYTRHAHHLIQDLKLLDVDLLSVDELLSLDFVEKQTEAKFSLQGNLDPLLLFCDEATVREHTRKLVATLQNLQRPAIANLGHGILPLTPVANARAFLEEASVLFDSKPVGRHETQNILQSEQGGSVSLS